MGVTDCLDYKEALVFLYTNSISCICSFPEALWAGYDWLV